MPIYEYECTACSDRHEVIQRFSDPAITDCPKCGGVVRKLISSPAIQFKGSGFYKTDYPSSSAKASKGGTGDAKGDSPASADKSESTSTKSETKSETKAETKSETKSGSGSD
ncbi:MAG TPA: FmdB family zinc ribbon protein [Thermoanaerobaculia bacterium]